MSKQDAFAPGLLSRLPESSQKIVLLRASRIGDFLCAIPAIRAMRKALPDAEITMITLPMLQELAQRSPYIDKIALFPGFPWIAEQLFEPRKTVQFLQQMQNERFDLAVQIQGTGLFSNPFTLLLGARTTAGFVRPDDAPGLLDAALPYPQRQHEIRTVMAMSTFLGASAQGEQLEFPLWSQDYQAAERLLHMHSVKPPLIGLHPAARDATRRWFVERFAEAGNILQQRHGGTVLLLGELEEQHTGEHLANLLHVPFLNLIGKTSLVSLGALMTHLSVFITNDTGPAHIAYALNIPTVTIFGGGDPALNGPLKPGPFHVLKHDVACRPCGYGTCPIGDVCLKGVTVDMVVQAAEDVFKDDITDR